MDISFLLWLQDFKNATNGFFDGFFDLLSYFGPSFWAFWMMGVIFWCFDKKAGMMMGLNVGFGNMINQLAKNIFCVPRPWVRDTRLIPTASSSGYSFPSGHAQLATAEWGSLAVWQKKRKWVVAICCVLIFLIALSRNYLGVHTPQDVLCSIALCSLVMFACYRIMNWVDGGNNRDILVFGIGLAIFVAYFLFVTLKSYPTIYAADGQVVAEPVKMVAEAWSAGGCAVGAFFAWFVERRFIRFEQMKLWWQKLLCAVIGGAMMYWMMNFASPFIANELKATGTAGYYIGKLLYFAILYFFIFAVFPAMIKLASYVAGKIKSK